MPSYLQTLLHRTKALEDESPRVTVLNSYESGRQAILDAYATGEGKARKLQGPDVLKHASDAHNAAKTCRATAELIKTELARLGGELRRAELAAEGYEALALHLDNGIIPDLDFELDLDTPRGTDPLLDAGAQEAAKAARKRLYQPKPPIKYDHPS